MCGAWCDPLTPEIFSDFLPFFKLQVKPFLAVSWPLEHASERFSAKQQISIVAIHKDWCSLDTLVIGTTKFPHPSTL